MRVIESMEMIQFAGGTAQIRRGQRLAHPGEIETLKITAFRQGRETVDASNPI